MTDHQQPFDRAFLADCDRVHREWHERAKSRDTEGLLALYAPDAILESPLVQAHFRWPCQRKRCAGTTKSGRFSRKARGAGPMRWCAGHRTEKWLTDGERMLVWEYPRATPDGDQVDILEVMEIADGLIRHHRIYWGWFGTGLLVQKRSRQGEDRRSLAASLDRKSSCGSMPPSTTKLAPVTKARALAVKQPGKRFRRCLAACRRRPTGLLAVILAAGMQHSS